MDLTLYPSQVPAVYFLSKALKHPLVNPETGRLDLSIQFPHWDKTMSLVLLCAYIKAVFYKQAYWDRRLRHEPFNLEMSQLWMENKEKFKAVAAKCVEQSEKEVMRNPDKGCSIRFAPLIPAHTLLQNRILSSTDEMTEEGFSFTEWFSDGVRNLGVKGVAAGPQAAANSPLAATNPFDTSSASPAPKFNLESAATPSPNVTSQPLKATRPRRASSYEDEPMHGDTIEISVDEEEAELP